MDTDLLARSIDEKHQVLGQLLELSKGQLALVGAEGDMTPLLRLLSTKQTLIDQLMKIERQLDPFREQDPDRRRWRSPADRQRCAQMARQCQSLLDEILRLEKQGETDLARRQQTVAAELRAVAGTADAHRAYSSGSPTTGQFDLTSQS